ncbi:MAG: hypothetical protein GW914_02940 [Candidatus Aenigmarchaeota archaeon]|nr:hypothetical protein [Candidatus Aenigmarchaeota archaeon]
MSIGGEYHLVFVGSSGPWLFLASSKNGKPTDVLGLAARIQGKELQLRYGDGIPKNQILVTVSAYDQQ